MQRICQKMMRILLTQQVQHLKMIGLIAHLEDTTQTVLLTKDLRLRKSKDLTQPHSRTIQM